MIGSISSALGGLFTASKQTETSAARIAGATVPGADDTLAQDVVALKIAEISYKANAATLRVADKMLEETTRLLDKRV